MTVVKSFRDFSLGLPGKLVLAGAGSPKTTICFWLFLAGMLSASMMRLDLDSSTSAFLDQASPAWQTYQRSLENYGGDEFVVVAIEGEFPFDREALHKVRDLTSRVRRLDGVRRVDSLSTVPLIRGDASGEIILNAALKHGVPREGEELDRLIADLRGDRIAPNSLFSEDGRVFAVNIMLDEDITGDRSQIVSKIQKLVEAESVIATGVPIFRTAVNSRTYREVFIFVPVTLLCISIVATLAFGSLRAVVLPLAVGAIGSLMVMGTMSLVGISLSLSTMVLPSILLALGCAYSMHMLAAAQGLPASSDLRAALVQVAEPVALSGLTTAIGFLAMGAVRISAIQQLAYLGALGVVTLTIATLSLGAAILLRWPIPRRRSGFYQFVRNRIRPHVMRSADRYRVRSLVVWFGLLVSMMVGVSLLRISTDIIVWFPVGSEIRDNYETIRAQLSGISPVNVVVTSRDSRDVTDPDVIRSIDELASWLERQPEVGKTLAVSDPLRQLHGVLRGEEDAGLPSTKEEIEQYLLILESVEYMQDVILYDRSGANVLLRVDDNGSDRLVELGNRVEQWWVENGVSDFSVETTGLMYEFGRSEERIAHGQVVGLGVALLTIGAVLLLILRVPKDALVALVPNAVPLVVAFGLMGFLDIPLDAATVCLGSLALGIAVDDTIHIMTGYKARLGAGESPSASLDYCIEQVLPALVFTTVAVVVGFAVLAFSQFTLIRNLGLVTSGLVLLCLIADLTLLPALVLSVQSRGSTTNSPESRLSVGRLER